MALKIDKQEGSLSSLEEMRIHVVFQSASGQIVGNTKVQSDEQNETIWVADSIGDLPCTGDFVVLTDLNTTQDKEPSKNSFKVLSRSIDFSAFASNNGRIVCTIKVENNTAM